VDNAKRARLASGMIRTPHKMEISVTAELDGKRLEQALAALVPGLSRNEAAELIARGGVRRQGRVERTKSTPVRTGDHLALDPTRLDERTAEERDLLAKKRADLQLLAKGSTWAAIRKPAGLPSTARHFGDPLHFAAYARELAGYTETLADHGLVHRLDTGTSGVCAVARDDATLQKLTAQRDSGKLYRIYWAIVAGTPRERELDLPIAHHPSDPARMVVVTEGTRHRGDPQGALTTVDVLASSDAASLIEARITGGRRHQIRVHLAAAGHPVLGDAIYGEPTDAPRLALHALRLRFEDPETRDQLDIPADPGRHFWAFAPALEKPL
jgi:23S rRNA pseudouridine1911/1915/1917 synthase